MTKAERAHMDAVVALGCLICGGPACIHHVRSGMGMGQRNDNFHVLPLCKMHHQDGPMGIAIHAGRRTWEAIHGAETELLERVAELLKRTA